MKRLDLELLRFLAAILVLLYHAQVPGFHAGYIGVDVFLVLSGYLLTESAIRKQQAGTFSVSNFMAGRLKRLAPMVFFVTSATLAFAYLVLPPKAYESHAAMAISQILFATNHVIASGGGYFENHIANNPLAHLWTISLEFQFYALLALSVWLLGSKKSLFVVFGFLGALSLALTIQQAGSISPNPYLLLHYRFWEFAAGAMLALAPWAIKRQAQTPKTVQNRLAWGAASVLILIGLAIGDRFLHNPGPILILPVLACALAIVYPLTFATRLGQKQKHWLLFAGASSFPLYLWHQPVFSFAKFESINLNDPLNVTALLITSLALAFASHWTLGQKLNLESSRAKYGLPVSLALMVFTVGLSVAVIKSDGFADRYQKHQLAVLQHFENDAPQYAYFQTNGVLHNLGSFCDFKDHVAALAQKPHHRPVKEIDPSCYTKQVESAPTVMLWGNSHAQHLRHGLLEGLGQTHNVLQVASSACPAQIVDQPSTRDYCAQSNWFALQTIEKQKPQTLILAGLVDYSNSRVQSLVQRAKALGVKEVIVVGPTIVWNASLPELMINDLTFRLAYPQERSFAFRADQMRKDRAAARELGSNPEFRYVSTFDAFCTGQGCLTVTDKDFLEHPLTWDDSHFTPRTSSVFFQSQLKRFFVAR